MEEIQHIINILEIESAKERDKKDYDQTRKKLAKSSNITQLEELKKQLKKYKFRNDYNNHYGLERVGEREYSYSYTQPVENFLLRIISNHLQLKMVRKDSNNEIAEYLIIFEDEKLDYDDICKRLDLPQWV